MYRLAPRRRWAALFSILALIALLAACGAGGAAVGAPAAAAPSVGSQVGAGGARPGASAALGNQLIADQRSIVKTGEVTLEVENVSNALSRVRAMAIELGGYVGGAQAGTLNDSATVTLRIPAARFDDAFSRLHEIAAKVLVESTREEDVTSTVVDMQARLKNLQASAAQYRVLVGRASSIDDILAVQSRLDEVQGQMEQITAQLKALTNQADLSTLTVTLQPRAQPIKEASTAWDPAEIAGSAVSALLQMGQAIATLAIWLGIVGLPVAIVLMVIGFVLLRLGVLRRPAAATPEP
jgi:hypothetical protein